MENKVRLESIKIEGIKNVDHGEIILNELSKIEQGQFLNQEGSVLGIYGQNGSGKTTVLEATKLIKIILSGESLPDNVDQYISNVKKEAKLEYQFYVESNHFKQIITYTMIISKNNKGLSDIVYERMDSKEYSNVDRKWKSKRKLFEVEKNEIILKKLLTKISMEHYIGFKVAKEIEVGSSLFFNERNLPYIIEELKDKDEEQLIDALQLLNVYVKTSLIIIENDKMGTTNFSSLLPINAYLSTSDYLKFGQIPLDLQNINELPESIYQDFEIIIKQIDLVIHALIPDLDIEIYEPKERLMKDGSKGFTFEVVSKRNNLPIPLKYESEGIKRIISITSSLIAMYNNPSICLMIDEFDSGIFEYLLGELIEVLNESAKGQFIFTSHNLRALEKLSYKSIILTTKNPLNRYTRFSNVKTNNNIRDFYYTAIMLGGQKEVLYNETKNYKIRKAFKKAGMINE